MAQLAEPPMTALEALANSPPPSPAVRIVLYLGLPVAAAYVTQIFSWQYWLLVVASALLIHFIVPSGLSLAVVMPFTPVHV